MKDSTILNGRNYAEISAMRILVYGEDKNTLTNYSRVLGRLGHKCLTAQESSQLEIILQDFQPDLVLDDLILPDAAAFDVLERVNAFDGSVPVILVAANGSIKNAVEAMKHHAADYLAKPFSVDELLDRVQEALSRRLLERNQSTAAVNCEENGDWREEIIGISPAMERVLDLVRKVSRTDANVLILGESGSGKELIARAIHQHSARRKEIFVPVDCASLPETLLESELFGYRKGAFTGAQADKMGLFEFAHKGTLFLDEIGEMPIALQAKLLRVLQERVFRPIGGCREIEVNVRIIAASNHDFKQALQERTFRSDLYYRLNVITLNLPPLRERPEDIPLLANYFLRKFAQDNLLPQESISSDALECLKEYRWPGNVRELQNVIEHAATLAADKFITLLDLPEGIRDHNGGNGGNGDAAQANPQLFPAKNKLVGDFEREYLCSLLVENQFNISRAAVAAGCHRRTLYRMIHRYKIDLAFIKEQRGVVQKTPSFSQMTET